MRAAFANIFLLFQSIILLISCFQTVIKGKEAEPKLAEISGQEQYEQESSISQPFENREYHPELRERSPLQLFKVYGVEARKLEVRLGPGKDTPFLYNLEQGAKVQVLALRGNWVQIGSSQWVLAKYLH